MILNSIIRVIKDIRSSLLDMNISSIDKINNKKFTTTTAYEQIIY